LGFFLPVTLTEEEDGIGEAGGDGDEDICWWRTDVERRNILAGLPTAASSCLFRRGNAHTVAVKAKAAVMVLMKCIISLSGCRGSFLYVKDVDKTRLKNMYVWEKRAEYRELWKTFQFCLYRTFGTVFVMDSIREVRLAFPCAFAVCGMLITVDHSSMSLFPRGSVVMSAVEGLQWHVVWEAMFVAFVMRGLLVTPYNYTHVAAALLSG
jgi:hypothetical protein